MMILRCIAIAAIAAGYVAASEATKQWQSPDRFYSISVPADWEQVTTTPKTHTTYRFISRDGQAEIAISATHDLELPEVLPNDVLEAAFPNEKGVTKIKRVSGSVWDGLKREYANTSDTTRWIGIAARNGSTVVLITMTAPTRVFDQFRDTFEKTGGSLKVGRQPD